MGWLPASFLESKKPTQKRDKGTLNVDRKNKIWEFEQNLKGKMANPRLQRTPTRRINNCQA